MSDTYMREASPSSGMPMPQAQPMPQAVPMAYRPQTQYANPTPVASGSDRPAPVQNLYGQQPNHMMGHDFASVSGMEPRQPQGIGQNGFGVHPDVGHDEIVNYLLPKFRQVESSHDYKNYIGKNRNLPQDPNQTASGAYGYIDKTWNHFQGYPRAMDAPPEVQDARMKQDLAAQLQRFQGDPFKVVANHYYPARAHDPSTWDQPLTDKYGKPIVDTHGKPAQTVKEYLQGVLPAERVDKYLASVGGNAQRPSDANRAPL